MAYIIYTTDGSKTFRHDNDEMMNEEYSILWGGRDTTDECIENGRPSTGT